MVHSVFLAAHCHPSYNATARFCSHCTPIQRLITSVAAPAPLPQAVATAAAFAAVVGSSEERRMPFWRAWAADSDDVATVPVPGAG